MTFVPSKMQQDFFDWIEKGHGSGIMKAVAGSGKTTTITNALKKIPSDEQILFLAFNKSIAEELKSRVPDYVTCKTMNALGHSAVFRKFGRVQLDSYKTRAVLDQMYSSGLINSDDVKEHGQVISKLVAIAKQVGLVPSTMSDKVSLLEDTTDNWEDLMDHYDIEIRDGMMPASMESEIVEQVISWTRTALTISIRETDVIDFNDQLYLPVVYDLPLPKYDWVFVDEAQDISAIQRSLLQKSLRKGGRLVAVGDPYQAIYGFRGADSKSLENIAKTFNCTTLPLSISYRCPKAVVREAQKFVPHIQSSPSAIEGSVKDLGEVKPDMFQIGDMVICRNTAPIIQLAYSLIANQKPAKVMGREIGEGLVSIIRKLKAKSIKTLETRLDEWLVSEKARLLKKDKDADLSKVEDKFECIRCFLQFANPASVDELVRSIQSLFGEEQKGSVTLSTVHKAKGLEAKRVFILDAKLMPSKYAKKPHQIEQEHNLFYVAVTRAQEHLFYVSSPAKKD